MVQRHCNCCGVEIPWDGFAVFTLSPEIGTSHKIFLARQELCKGCENELYYFYQTMKKVKKGTKKDGAGK